MFLYVTGIKTHKDALLAIKNGANAIGLELGYKKNALQAEACRTWLEQLPFYVMKAGIFSGESYYDVEEMASFCHLDIIHLRDAQNIEDFSHYSGRLLVETASPNFEDIQAHGCILNLASVAQVKTIIKKQTQKPILLQGNFGAQEWQIIFDSFTPAGIAVDIASIKDLATWVAYR